MKQILFFSLVILSCLPLSAQRIGRTLIHVDRLQRDGHELQAMDSATYVLTIDNDNLTAKNFVYQHWDKTMKKTRERLARLSDEQDLKQAKERIVIYRQLDDIHRNLMSVPMPLYGPNNRWVWQPDLGYYTGTYDTERMRVFDMVLKHAEEAIREYDIQLAKDYYEYALDNLLIEDERESNVRSLVKYVNEHWQKLAQTPNIYERIVAYNMIDISLWLDPTQSELETRKSELQTQISDMYLQLAEETAQAGDTITAAEYRLSAQDWQIVTPDDGE